MDFFLKSERLEVQMAEDKVRAAKALHSHTKKESIRQSRLLLSSAKGISASFAAGVIKGASQDKSSTSSSLFMMLRKYLLSAWIA